MCSCVHADVGMCVRILINVKAIQFNYVFLHHLNKGAGDLEVQGRGKECGARDRQGSIGRTQRSREGKEG